MLFFCFILGVVLGIVVAVSSDDYLAIINSSNKNLYSLINGTGDWLKIFWKQIKLFTAPIILILIFGLSYYTIWFGYVIIIYQSSLLILSSVALSKIYGISGLINVIFLIVPINLFNFGILCYLVVVCVSRSRWSFKHKDFKFGYNKNYFISVGFVLLAVVLLSLFSSFAVSVFLKNANFLIF